MRSKLLFVGCLTVVGSIAIAAADQPPYRVQKGDTLWDVSGRFWNDPEEWPELWALNPQFHNPHIIFPGDPIFLKRPEPEEVSVRLPLDRIEPKGVGPSAAAPAGAQQARAEAAGPVSEVVSLARKGTQDFVSSHRIDRLGTVSNRRMAKVVYTAGEDVEIELASPGALKPGDVATVFDDTMAVVHPINHEPEGYRVRVLGQVRIRAIAAGRAIGRLTETYDAVEDGAGVMAHRPAITQIVARAARTGVEGVVLPSSRERTVFAADDVVFLDKGSIHGLEPGDLLEVPVPVKPRPPEGMVDLVRPLASLVVVSVQDKTATGVIVDSRSTVGVGDRFVAAAVSP